MSDKEKQEFLRDITSISNDDGETWTCAFCEMEKESTVENVCFGSMDLFILVVLIVLLEMTITVKDNS